MLNRIKLDRFKAFKDADIQFRRITVIAGQNSSGKSSILQAVNAICQSTLGRSFPFDLILNGDRAHLGGFKNVVNGHNAKNSFGITVWFQDEEIEISLGGTYKKSDEEGHLFPRLVSIGDSEIGDLLIEWNQKKQRFSLRATPSESLIESEKEQVNSAVRRLLRSEGKDKVESFLRSVGTDDPAGAVEAVSQLLLAAADEVRSGIEFETDRFSTFIQKISNHAFYEPYRRRATEALSRFRRNCAYIGPVRAHPARYYPIAGADSIDSSGEGMSRVLAKWKDRRSSLISELKAALAQLELAADLSAVVEHDEFLKVLVRPHGRSTQDSLADVGFGLSQVMPMLVADLNLSSGGLLLVNQPEIHLHPSSQALLANYFAGRIRRRQYIVETHSEYLINRLRLLVAKGELSSADVGIVYCGKDGKGGSRIYPVDIEADGSLSGAPDDFFQTYSADAFGIAMAVMQEGDHAEE